MDFTLWLQKLSSLSLAGNTGQDYLMAILWFLGLLIIVKLFQVLVVTRLKALAKKTVTDFDDTLIDVFAQLKPPFYLLVALYFSIKLLILPNLVNQVINILFILVVVYEVIRAIEKLGSYLINKYFAKRSGDNVDEAKHNQSIAKIFMLIVKVILWAVGITVALANMGVNVNSLVASLGIGGIAIALAIQNILSDLFSSFSLYFDKPFEVGDYIVVGEHRGTVEKIGMKTTRLISTSGEQLVISNNELTSTHIQNYGRMQKRRSSFQLGVVYGISPEKLASIPDIVKQVISEVEQTEFDRCHFKSYGDFSLNFETVFYVDSADYVTYMDILQQINLEIYKRFASEKIEFAYPTQTVFVNKG